MLAARVDIGGSRALDKLEHRYTIKLTAHRRTQSRVGQRRAGTRGSFDADA